MRSGAYGIGQTHLTLFLGYPTYSLTVALFRLLVYSGLGTILGESSSGRSDRALAIWLGSLDIRVLFCQFQLPARIEAFASESLALRIRIAIALIAPLIGQQEQA